MRSLGINSLPTLCGCVGAVSSVKLNKPTRRDGRREPDSGLRYTQDYRSQRRVAGEQRRVQGRPAGDLISEVTGIHRNSQWDFPRKRALFTSDGTDSMTSGSDTTEGYAD